jgi:hypothetical protein
MKHAILNALWLLAGMTGCAEVAPLTEVLVTVESELAVPDPLAVVEFVISDRTDAHVLARRSYEATRAADGRLAPFSVSLVPQGTNVDWFWLLAVGHTRDSDGALHEVVWVRRWERFARGMTVPLRIELSPACVGKPCGPMRSCDPRAGACMEIGDTPSDVDAGALDAATNDAQTARPDDARAAADGTRPDLTSEEAGAWVGDATIVGDAEAAPCRGAACDAAVSVTADASAAPADGAAPDGGLRDPEPREGGTADGGRSEGGARDSGPTSDAGQVTDAAQASDGGRTCTVDSDCRRPEICDHTLAPAVCMPRLTCPNCDLRYNRCDVAFAPGGCVGQGTPCEAKLPVCNPKTGDHCAAERCDLSEFCCASCYCTPRGQSCLPVQCPL